MSPIYLLALEFLRSAITGFCFRQFGLRASQVGLVRNALERFLRAQHFFLHATLRRLTRRRQLTLRQLPNER